MPIGNTIGRRVSLMRNRRGLTQLKLAGRVGMKVMQISTIELDKRRLTAEEAVRIARVLGVKVEWLVEGKP